MSNIEFFGLKNCDKCRLVLSVHNKHVLTFRQAGPTILDFPSAYMKKLFLNIPRLFVYMWNAKLGVLLFSLFFCVPVVVIARKSWQEFFLFTMILFGFLLPYLMTGYLGLRYLIPLMLVTLFFTLRPEAVQPSSSTSISKKSKLNLTNLMGFVLCVPLIFALKSGGMFLYRSYTTDLSYMFIGANPGEVEKTQGRMIEFLTECQNQFPSRTLLFSDRNPLNQLNIHS